ncbi:MAG: hypothetical protein IJ368_08660 [Oscillospiraceae bacterium]|nr:hypothetical protein [Oscillospiraceae bacterium]
MAMMKIRDIKSAAYGRLSKCWAECAFITLLHIGVVIAVYVLLLLIARFTGIHTAPSVLPEFNSMTPVFIAVSLIVMAVAYIALSPLFLGIRWYFWQASGGTVMPVSSVFAVYSSDEQTKRCIKLRLMIDIRKLVLLFAAVTVAFMGISLAERLQKMWAGNIAVEVFINGGCAVLVAGVMLLYIVVGMKYLPAGFLMAENPDASVSEVMELCERIVGKKYTYLLALYCSYAGWYAACLLVFPILFIIPIMYMTTAVFIRESLRDIGFSRDDSAAETEKELQPVG